MLEPESNLLIATALVTLLGIAVITDIDSWRIPNKLVVIGLAIGMLGNASFGGVGALALAFAGGCVGLLCLLPFYALGGMSAGDVKLMAMSGAFLGPALAVVAAVFSLAVGGLVGIAWYFWHYKRPEKNTDEFIHGGAVTVPSTTLRKSVRPAIPFAVAIGAGTILTLVAAPHLRIALA